MHPVSEPPAEPPPSRSGTSRPVGSLTPKMVVPVGSGGPSELTNPRWGSPEYLHQDVVEMLVDAPPALEGRRVRFVIEHSQNGRWERLAETTGVVRHGVAVGLVEVAHPAQRQQTGMHFQSGTDVGPRTMRFTAALVP